MPGDIKAYSSVQQSKKDWCVNVAQVYEQCPLEKHNRSFFFIIFRRDVWSLICLQIWSTSIYLRAVILTLYWAWLYTVQYCVYSVLNSEIFIRGAAVLPCSWGELQYDPSSTDWNKAGALFFLRCWVSEMILWWYDWVFVFDQSALYVF